MGYGYRGFRDYGFAPYVPVGERLAKGRRRLEQLAKQRGRPASPVLITGRTIAKTFWGAAWCKNLEAYSDYENRLPRGRAYVRNGSVLDLHVAAGRIEAQVAGSALYSVTIEIKRLAVARWRQVIAGCAGRIGSLIGLLRGELSDDVLAVLTGKESGIFPAPREIAMRCSCPDVAGMCKHLAAVLYGVGVRLDERPELFFVLRQVEQQELLAGANAADVLATVGVGVGVGVGVADAQRGKGRRLAVGAVGAMFGIELDEGEAAGARVPTAKVTAKATAKVTAKVTAKATAKATAKVTAKVTAKATAKVTAAKRNAVQPSARRVVAGAAKEQPRRVAPSRVHEKQKPK